MSNVVPPAQSVNSSGTSCPTHEVVIVRRPQMWIPGNWDSSPDTIDVVRVALPAATEDQADGFLYGFNNLSRADPNGLEWAIKRPLHPAAASEPVPVESATHEVVIIRRPKGWQPVTWRDWYEGAEVLYVAVHAATEAGADEYLRAYNWAGTGPAEGDEWAVKRKLPEARAEQSTRVHGIHVSEGNSGESELNSAGKSIPNTIPESAETLQPEQPSSTLSSFAVRIVRYPDDWKPVDVSSVPPVGLPEVGTMQGELARQIATALLTGFNQAELENPKGLWAVAERAFQFPAADNPGLSRSIHRRSLLPGQADWLAAEPPSDNASGDSQEAEQDLPPYKVWLVKRPADWLPDPVAAAPEDAERLQMVRAFYAEDQARRYAKNLNTHEIKNPRGMWATVEPRRTNEEEWHFKRKHALAEQLTVASRGMLKVRFDEESFFGYDGTTGHAFNVDVSYGPDDEDDDELRVMIGLDDRDGPIAEQIKKQLQSLADKFTGMIEEHGPWLDRVQARWERRASPPGGWYSSLSID